MTPEELEPLIERAGLAGIIQLFGRTIEIDPYDRDGDGIGHYTAETALTKLLDFYASERVAQERQKILDALDAQVSEARQYYRDHQAPGNEYLYDVAETWEHAATFVRSLPASR